MPRRVTLREANQHLSRLIQAVETGEELIITRRGQPVARLSRIEPQKKVLSPKQEAALRRMQAHMDAGYQLGGQLPSRDSLHER